MAAVIERELEWDEELARSWISLSFRPKVDPELRRRAQEEYQKQYNAYAAVRPPQDQLDPRILELVSNPAVPMNTRPLLYYGLMFHRSDREAYIQRNELTILDDPMKPGTAVSNPDQWAGVYEATAEATVEGILSVKCMLPLRMRQPLGFDSDVFVCALDDTQKLCQFQKDAPTWWDKRVSRVLKTLRLEFGLGDQQPKWYWSSDFDASYNCPLPEYNPPQVRFAANKTVGRVRL